MRLELSPLAVTDLQAIGDYIALDSPGNATPMSPYSQLQTRLQAEPHTWVVTGVAGFIGSNLAPRRSGAPPRMHSNATNPVRGEGAAPTKKQRVASPLFKKLSLPKRMK